MLSKLLRRQSFPLIPLSVTKGQIIVRERSSFLRYAEHLSRTVASSFWSVLSVVYSDLRIDKSHLQDEATSNVDVETDAKVQRTIQTEFSTSTLLCIAHRLNTIGMEFPHSFNFVV